ncbi:MAG: AAA family ATPase [Deltaproteobacteria bacterium]|nr:AAA family ATPase [Myxococcales bacterium]MDP3215578.1 AAA family ATPase [Deltaproteobacteria bacterium]
MLIQRLHLQDFHGFADVTLDLARPLTVLAGVNGAGKSSLLDALSVIVGAVAVQLIQRPMLVPTLRPMDIRRDAPSTTLAATLAFGAAHARITASAERHGPLAVLASEFSSLPATSLAPSVPAQCLAIYFHSTRNAAPDLSSRWKDGTPNATTTFDALDGALGDGSAGFVDLFRWFRDREDFENAEKVDRDSLAWVDPQLHAVRSAVTALLPGFSRLRVDRAALRMTVDKDGAALFLDQLSDGERNLLALTADVARRLAIANPDLADALSAEAVVLIDEIELHLHPSWQRRVLGGLTRTFPRCQFIVTTHSPQVLSEVPNDAVVVVKDFACYRPVAPTEGRDSNAILWEVLGVPAHPADVVAELDAIVALLDDGTIDAARARLDALAAKVTDRDPEVQRLRKVLDVVERLDASDPEGR